MTDDDFTFGLGEEPNDPTPENPLGDQTRTVRLEASGIAVEVDLHQILTAIDPNGRWRGYDPDADVDVFEPSSLEHQLVDATAALLVKSLRKDVKDMVAIATRDAITAEVESVVRETMGEGVQQTTDWGSPTGAPTPLRELIGAEVEKAVKVPELREGYSRSSQKTMVQRIISNEVEKALTAELKSVIDQAKKDAIKAVQTQAGAVIAEAVRRATPGL